MKWPETYHLNNRQHQYENMFRCPRSEASFASGIAYIPMVKKNGFTKVYPNVWGSIIIDDAKTSRLYPATFGIPTCRLKSKDSKVNHISKENSSLHLAASWLFSPGHVEVSNPWGHPIQVMDDHSSHAHEPWGSHTPAPEPNIRPSFRSACAPSKSPQGTPGWQGWKRIREDLWYNNRHKKSTSEFLVKSRWIEPYWTYFLGRLDYTPWENIDVKDSTTHETSGDLQRFLALRTS